MCRPHRTLFLHFTLVVDRWSLLSKSFPCHTSKFPSRNSFPCHTYKIPPRNSFTCHTSINTRLKVLCLPHIFKNKGTRSISGPQPSSLPSFPTSSVGSVPLWQSCFWLGRHFASSYSLPTTPLHTFLLPSPHRSTLPKCFPKGGFNHGYCHHSF
jgi:hypothetical protein